MPPKANPSESNVQPQNNFLTGVNILIVDDSEINQFLIKKSLDQIGVTSDFAANGLSAVEKIKEKKWDIVLMDLFMPEINGFEATRIVRGLEGKYFKDLPIIALTSHPFDEIQEEIFAAGMTDFLTKPLDAKLVADLIKSYIQVRPLGANPSSLEPDKIRFKKAFHHSMQDQSFYRELLEMVRDNLVELNSRVLNALDNSDGEAIQKHQHKIRPALKLIENEKIDDLLTLARKTIGQSGNSTGLRDIIQQIDQQCSEAISEISTELQQITPG